MADVVNVPPANRAAAAPAPPTMADAAEMLWVVLANVNGGDWSQQTSEWQAAAARWRDYYFSAVQGAAAPASVTGFAEWWVCFPCWKAYHVPTTGYYGKCECGKDTVRWPADPNETLRMIEWRRPSPADRAAAAPAPDRRWYDGNPNGSQCEATLSDGRRCERWLDHDGEHAAAPALPSTADTDRCIHCFPAENRYCDKHRPAAAPAPEGLESESAKAAGIPNLWRLVDRLTIRTGSETELNREADLARRELLSQIGPLLRR